MARPAPVAHLPIELSALVGRRRELAHLRTLLSVDRLVTVTGTGGVGKTRLVVELARTAVFDFPDGVWFVELARIESDDLVGAAIAEAVDAPRDGQAAGLERAVRRLRDGRRLLVLDNCEHVLEGAAAAAWDLLTQCPDLVVVATSRSALAVRGERISPLLPLAVDALDDGQGAAGTADAVRLFCDRAQLIADDGDIRPAIAADAASVCRLLDGLPLALELAAAWVPMLSLRQIRDRLDGSIDLPARDETSLPARHRTIRAALDWSERLLTPAQAEAFARLSVFVGGFSLEGAAAVLDGIDGDGGGALEMVGSLVARSLVTCDNSADAARYRLLEPVRQYAAERLRSGVDDETSTRRRHLEHLVELAEKSDAAIIGGPDEPAMQRLDAELGNVRAALAWGFDEAPATAARLVGALMVYCRHRGLFEEGREWALRSAGIGGAARMRSLCMAAWLASEMGEASGAIAQLKEAHRLATDGGGPREVVMVLMARSHTEYVLGDLDAMQATGAEALGVARGSADDALLMWAVWGPAVAAAVRGEGQLALDLFSEGLAVARRLDNRTWGTVLATNVAETAVDMGEDGVARAALRDLLDSPAAEDVGVGPSLVENAGMLAIRGGDTLTGLRMFAATRAALDRSGYRETADEATRRQQWIATARAELARDAADLAWSGGATLALADALAEAKAVVADVSPEDRAGLGETGPANAFVRNGALWSLTFAGETRPVRDSKGVRDIARLLAARGGAVAAVDLVLADRWPSDGAGTGRPAAGLGLGELRDAGEVVDGQARAQYRARLAELEEEVREAEEDNDLERAGRGRDEREFLLAELGAAVGLGGRPRRALDPAERARKTVAWRVRASIRHIEAAHPALGQHLRRSVRTGSFCSYDPAEPTTWSL